MNITYDAKSFLINGKREWLFLGEIHYFRFPKEEWRKVINLAKQGHFCMRKTRFNRNVLLGIH